MDAPHLVLALLDDGVELQVVDDRLRVEFPHGIRKPDRAAAIRSSRDRLIDLATRSPAAILADLRQARIILILHNNEILAEGDRTTLTTEQHALFRLHRAGLIDELRRERAEGVMVVGRTWSISPEILEFGPEELDAYHGELVNCPEEDPATPEEWASLTHARRVRGLGTLDMLETRAGKVERAAGPTAPGVLAAL